MVQIVVPVEVTVEPSNVITNAVRSEAVPAPPGEIVEVLAVFATGANNTIHAVLEDGEGQVFPQKGGDVHLNVEHAFKTRIPISRQRPLLRLVAWADAGNSFPHVITFYVTVEVPEAV